MSTAAAATGDQARQGFWRLLPRPILAAAPLSGISDTVFRAMLAAHGKPQVIYTEFVSCAGLVSRGRERLLPDLWYGAEQRPIVAQVFGREPEHFRHAAAMLAEAGFDGIDINAGCPDRSVEKQGAGAKLLLELPLLQELVLAARAGAAHLPISVKTRLGYAAEELERIIPALLAVRPAAIALHGRTRTQRYRGEADWPAIGRAAAMTRGSGTLLLGNGDVHSLAQARALAAEHGTDGVMVGRALCGNPWFFNPAVTAPSPAMRRAAIREHLDRFADTFGDRRNFHSLKKHLKWYVTGMPGAKELRQGLMACTGIAEVRALLAAPWPGD